MTMKKEILLLIALCMGVTAAFAQEKKDSVSINFDATSKAFEKRYRYPDAVPFEKNWKNNIYISLFGGMDKLVPRGEHDFNMGGIGGIAANWQFSAHHTLRGSLLIGSFARKIDNETMTRIGLQADHLFNLTSYWNGYNPGRVLEFLTVAGIGMNFSSMANENLLVPDFHMGLQLKLHPAANMDFYLEPRLSLLGDGIDHSSTKNWRRYDVSYGATVGMNYRFKAWTPFGKVPHLKGDKIADNSFISIMGGAQLQSSELVQEVGMINSMEPHFAISVGKWLLPAVALRFSLFESADTWHMKVIEPTEEQYGEAYLESCTYAGVRLEAMVNASYFFNGHRNDTKWSWNALLGGELGSLRKENSMYPAKGGYTGITGGVQLKYRLFDDLSLFVEPRMTLASYSQMTNEMVDDRRISKRFSDNLFNINLGVELSRAPEERRMAGSVYKDEFVPHYFATLAGGFAIPLEVKRYRQQRYFNYTAMAGFGWQFAPNSAARLALDYGPLTVSVKGGNVDFTMMSASIDYMWNVGNVMMGYDPERKYDVQLLFGPVATMRSGSSRETSDEELNKGKTLFGLSLGSQLSYQVAPHFKVFAEPKVRFLSGNGLLRQSTIQGKDIITSLTFGTSYSF